MAFLVLQLFERGLHCLPDTQSQPVGASRPSSVWIAALAFSKLRHALISSVVGRR
jgi:hypothetical protein